MNAPRAIDMHSHYYGGLVEDLIGRDVRPYVTRAIDGALTLHAMTASTPIGPGYVDLDARLKYMDERRIASQLLTFPGALGVDVIPGRAVCDAIVRFNTRLAAICRGSGGRFHGLAGLPLADMAAAVGEMHRVRRELGLAGAILPGNYFLSIDHVRQLEPVFDAANAARALLMIHPGLKVGEGAPAPFADTNVQRSSSLALQASLSQMGLTVIVERLAERYPDIVFQLVNLGGTLPFIVERMEAVALTREPYLPFPRAALRGMVYDCASLGPRALELAVKVFGADRIMLGTDYPIFSPDPVREAIETADLPAADRDLILYGTAQTVLGGVYGG
ncbi:MAG: amidohydrolase family protein [Pseudolabrys sp.]|jgi:predicted TIM-barrel fold metal-dependent hydrolase